MAFALAIFPVWSVLSGVNFHYSRLLAIVDEWESSHATISERSTHSTDFACDGDGDVEVSAIVVISQNHHSSRLRSLQIRHLIRNPVKMKRKGKRLLGMYVGIFFSFSLTW